MFIGDFVPWSMLFVVRWIEVCFSREVAEELRRRKLPGFLLFLRGFAASRESLYFPFLFDDG